MLKPNDDKLDNLAILVPSCDKFCDVWPHFFYFLFKFWPTFAQKLYLISNQKTFQDERVTPFYIESETSWSLNVKLALQNIQEDYILIILEDFLLNDYVDTEKLSNLLQLMKQEDIGYFRLMANPPSDIPHNIIEHVGYIHERASYRTSLQVAIWNKKVLQDLLVNHESPWQFELNATIRSRKVQKPFLSIDCQYRQPIPYFPNAIVRGKWVREAIKYLKTHNRIVESNRIIETKIEALWRKNKIRDFISKTLVQPLRGIA